MAKRTRRIFIGFGVAILALLVAVLAFPVWFPWLLRPVADSQGLHYSSFERRGYQRFVLRNVTFTNKNLTFKAGRAEAFVPTVWLLKKNKSAEQNFVTANDWQLDFAKPQQPAASKATKSIHAQIQQTDKALSEVKKWLPRASLSNGVIRANQKTFELARTEWNRGILFSEINISELKQSGTIRLVASAPKRFEIKLASASLGLDAAIQILAPMDGLEIQSTNFWRSNRFELSAHFKPDDKLPDTASLRADSFAIPADLIRLENYRDVHGSLIAHWTNGQFVSQLTANSQPITPSPTNQSLEIFIQAHGDTNSALIESGKILLPGLVAEVSENIRLNFSGPILSNKVSVKLDADFDQQPWLALRGKLNGTATFTPSNEKFPTATFALSGAQIGGFGLSASNVHVTGDFVWPNLRLNETRIQFSEDSMLTLKGNFDVQRKISDGHIDFAGTFGRQFLPAGFSYERGTLSGEFSGPFTNVAHHGDITLANFSGAKLKPTEIRVNWKGDQMRITDFDLRAAAGKSVLALRGDIAVKKKQMSLALDSLVLETNSVTALKLQKPFRVSFARDQERVQLRTESIRLAGEHQELSLEADVNWPQRGVVNVTATNLSPRLLADFVELPPETFELTEFRCSSDWSNSPIRTLIGFAGKAALTNGVSFAAEVRAGSDEKGFSIGSFSVASESETVLTASGFFPLKFVPGHREFVELNSASPLQLSASTQPSPLFWSKLKEWTGIEMESPNGRVEVEGTWENPRGQIELTAAKIQMPKLKRPLPNVEDVHIVVTLEEQVARLKNFEFAVQDQPVTIMGKVPLGREFWLSLLKKPALPDWRKADARVVILEAQVAPFTPLLPKILSPQGTLNLDLIVKPGIQLDGKMTLRDARTRPLGGFGVVREIAADLKFADAKVILENAKGLVGNDFISVTGEVSLEAKKSWAEALPIFAVHVTGDNIPLSRTPDAIVRADLSLDITNSATTQPVIFGGVNLRDSYYLSDVRALVPGKVAKATRRPPYFSVEEEPFSDWFLNLRVTGKSFMRVRSPLFRGVASANFKLSGTLKEPVALGDATIESGAVRFPFGTLRVEQGMVSLTSENPFRPQLFLTASAKKYGYDIKMQTRGPADQPIVEFSSVPALSSEQIVLMLTAGEAPANVASLSTQQRAQGMALFVGKGLLTTLGFGNEDSEERLTVRSGEQVTETGKPTLDVEYKLTERWSLVGEYDRFNAYNVGAKWRVYSK
jgi:translocation and assembly module TamB